MLNSFSFDRNGNLMQLDDIIAEKSRRKPSPSPLPPADMTIRFRFSNPDFDPNTLEITAGTWTKVQYAAGNDWDFTYDNPKWDNLFESKFIIENGTVDIIDNGNLSNITGLNMTFKFCTGLAKLKLNTLTKLTSASNMCNGCTNLSSAELHDTEVFNQLPNAFDGCSALTEISLPKTGNNVNFTYTFWRCTSLSNYDNVYMDKVSVCPGTFNGCTALKTVKPFDGSSVVAIANMYQDCPNVETGMYDLYLLFKEKMPYELPVFTNCGTNTESGRADRAKIPVSWGGDMQ